MNQFAPVLGYYGFGYGVQDQLSEQTDPETARALLEIEAVAAAQREFLSRGGLHQEHDLRSESRVVTETGQQALKPVASVEDLSQKARVDNTYKVIPIFPFVRFNTDKETKRKQRNWSVPVQEHKHGEYSLSTLFSGNQTFDAFVWFMGSTPYANADILEKGHFKLWNEYQRWLTYNAYAVEDASLNTLMEWVRSDCKFVEGVEGVQDVFTVKFAVSSFAPLLIQSKISLNISDMTAMPSSKVAHLRTFLIMGITNKTVGQETFSIFVPNSAGGDIGICGMYTVTLKNMQQILNGNLAYVLTKK